MKSKYQRVMLAYGRRFDEVIDFAFNNGVNIDRVNGEAIRPGIAVHPLRCVGLMTFASSQAEADLRFNAVARDVLGLTLPINVKVAG